ncbi:MAG: DUF4301 family protein [Saprospiraceae bacterium]|nr:DUF4301 family protein [Saprospiraceae bacterium]
MFSKQDLQQFKEKGIELSQIESQIDNFKKGFPFVDIISPATPGKGIKQFDNDEIASLIKLYNEKIKNRRVVKFVPASGAASRMFKHLFEFRENYKGTAQDIAELESDKGFNSVYNFLNHLQDFAFYNDLKNVMLNNGLDIEKCFSEKDYNCIIDYLLFEKGLNYSEKPKALLKFHKYADHNRMAIEEHLVEGANYSRDADSNVYIHFTVSPEHQESFIENINLVKPIYEEKLGVKYNIIYSVQKPSTDTIAVDMNNNPFRNNDGSILFRPGGHGALIENLNEIDADIIFVKNIDNIVPDGLRDETYKYKKLIGGYLLKLQQQIFYYLEILGSGNISNEELEEIIEFCENVLYVKCDFDGMERIEKLDFLYNILNRPLRVCGMVKNEGEPGGGPFIVKDQNGNTSLQIVESSQIDSNNPEQMAFVSQATHFNPVDLVCAVKDIDGKKYNLMDFVDPSTGFISKKSKDGKDLKAQELPGLWNGAMAFWNTIFVDVPIITFNPVKTVNDLLREEHC